MAGGVFLMGSNALSPNGSVVIVGASLSGLRTAESLRHEGFAGSITLIGNEPHRPYDRPPLSKQVLSGKWPVERTILADDDKIASLDLTLELGVAATRLDQATLSVGLADGTERAGDRIVIATGARPRTLLGTRDHERVVTLRTWEDALHLHRELIGLDAASRIVVIGSGFIGAEVASTAHGLGHAVTVIEALDVPLGPIVGESIGAAIGKLATNAGVTLRTSSPVDSVDPDPGGPNAGLAGAVVLASGERIAADLIVVGIGVIPNTEWLSDSGLAVDNGVVVDGALFATDSVMAVGDVARFAWHHDGAVDLVRIEHWTVAADHGAHAGKALLAGRAAALPISLVPYFWSDQYGSKIQVLGRPSPTDEVLIVNGSLDEQRFVALFKRGDRLSAALGLSRPRQLMAFRAPLLAGCSIEEALAIDLG